MSLNLFAQSDTEYMEGTLYGNEGTKVGFVYLSSTITHHQKIYYKKTLDQKKQKFSGNNCSKFIDKKGKKWKKFYVQHPGAVTKVDVLIPSFIQGKVEVYQYGHMMNNFYPSNHYYITNGVESEKLKRKGSKLKAQIEKYLINQPSIIEKLNSLPKVKLEEVFPLIIEYNKNDNVQ